MGWLFPFGNASKENLFTILRAVLPFFVIMILMVVILTAFPDLVFFLPSKMMG